MSEQPEFPENVKRPDRPEELFAPLTRINCPGCRVAFAHPIHPRTLIQDESVLVCRTDGCKQRDKEWDVPVAVLTAHKKA